MDIPTPPDGRMPFAEWLFWLSWVVASMAAILISFGIIYASVFIATVVFPGINEDRFAGGLMLPIVGTAMGALQWLVLRTRIVKSGWWVVATAVGMLG